MQHSLNNKFDIGYKVIRLGFNIISGPTSKLRSGILTCEDNNEACHIHRKFIITDLVTAFQHIFAQFTSAISIGAVRSQNHILIKLEQIEHKSWIVSVNVFHDILRLLFCLAHHGQE